jgi:hypothetical protein
MARQPISSVPDSKVSDSDLIAAVSHAPRVTAERWRDLDPDLHACFGAEAMKLIAEHHVDGLVYDAIQILGWKDRISPYVLNNTRRRSELSAARYEAHFSAFKDLADAYPDVIANTLLIKGAIIGPLYRSLRHRIMGDFDLLTGSDHLPDLMSALERLGYEYRPGGFGCDMVKATGLPSWTNLGSVTMHVFTLRDDYVDHCSPGLIRDVACLVPHPNLLMMNLLTNTFGHAVSWSYSTFGGDLQLIRAIDVAVVAESMPELDASGMWHLALKSGLYGEAAIGLYVQKVVCGELPALLKELEPFADAVAECADLYAMPDGTIGAWDISLWHRMFHPNRTAVALEMLDPSLATPNYLHELREGFYQKQEPTHLIAKRARELLAPLGIVAPADTAFSTQGGASMA